MGAEENKAIARYIFENYEQPDLSIFEHFADVIEWTGHQIDYEVNHWIPETEKALTRDQMREAHKGYIQQWGDREDGSNRLEREFISVTGEGDRVILEYITRGTKAEADDQGSGFDLRVGKIVEFLDGKVVRMREYCDTGHLKVTAQKIGQQLKEIEREAGHAVADR